MCTARWILMEVGLLLFIAGSNNFSFDKEDL
jgi:hypothetical protein